MMERITDTLLSLLIGKEEKAIELRDTELSGFGACLTSGRQVEFFFEYDSKEWNPQTEKLDITWTRQSFGTWEQHCPNPDWRIFNADMARGKASLYLVRVRQNKDPFIEENVSKGSRKLFADFLDEFLPKHTALKDLAPSTSQEYADMISKWIKPELGHIPLCELTKAVITDYHHKRSQKQPHATRKGKMVGGLVRANRELSLIKCALYRAIEWEYLESNPAVGLKKFKERARQIWAQDDELVRLMNMIHKDKAKGGIRQSITIDAVLLALLTGARKQELRMMEKKHLSFEGDTGIWKKPPSITKSKQWEITSLSSEAVKIIKRRINESKGNGWIFPHRRDPARPITDFAGWRSYRQRIGCEHINFHDLRHTASTHAVMKDGDIYDVSKALDHKDVSTTERYTHADLTAKIKAVGYFEQNVKRWKELAANKARVISLHKSERTNSHGKTKLATA